MLTSRTLYAALLALGTLASTATAQRSRATPGPSIVVGPMLGVSFSSLSTSNEAVGVDIRNRTGFVAGGFVTFNASSHVAVEPQLVYIQKGATAVTTGTGFNSITYALDYIQVPVLIKGRYWSRRHRVVQLSGHQRIIRRHLRHLRHRRRVCRPYLPGSLRRQLHRRL